MGYSATATLRGDTLHLDVRSHPAHYSCPGQAMTEASTSGEQYLFEGQRAK